MILELEMREIGNLATHSKTTKDAKTLEKKKFVYADDDLFEVAWLRHDDDLDDDDEDGGDDGGEWWGGWGVECS